MEKNCTGVLDRADCMGVVMQGNDLTVTDDTFPFNGLIVLRGSSPWIFLGLSYNCLDHGPDSDCGSACVV